MRKAPKICQKNSRINKSPPRPWPPPLPDLPLAIKIRATDVEAVDMAGDDAEEEEAAVDEAVCLGACEKEDGEWGEEYVD